MPRQPRNQSRPCIDLKGYLPMPEPCPIATMDAFAREFLAACHTEARERAVQAGRASVACKYCGRDYQWHVREGVCWLYEDDSVATPMKCEAAARAKGGRILLRGIEERTPAQGVEK